MLKFSLMQVINFSTLSRWIFKDELMQGFSRGNFRKNKYNNNFDNSICQQNGIYCPTFNITYKQSIKAGQPFPLYRGKIVHWMLVDKIKKFILS